MNPSSPHYLVSCVCGLQLSVAASQAGEEQACSCGKSVLIPRLRELSRLPVAPPSEGTRLQPTGGKWSLPKGILFAIGLPLTLLALAFAINYAGWHSVYDVQKPSVKDAKYPVEIMQLTPSQSMQLWQSFLADGLPARPQNDYIARRDIARRLLRDMWTCLGIALLGATSMVLAFLIPARTRNRASPPRHTAMR